MQVFKNMRDVSKFRGSDDSTSHLLGQAEDDLDGMQE
jgi:hypothetical protein